uniref:Uncharacterized protein n=1 Tax=Oryza rufipogon TaxID=4529 RepID=A0A0E0PAS9_ORYRU
MGQKLRLANWQIAQANSHMLAERNLGRDRVRSWLSDHFVNPVNISAPGHYCSTSSAFKIKEHV